ncbi:hypothetical protein [Streptomyces scopuliridis]|uniref:Uncharacterized protein n=1 Tax=Streptomyces scopuliridis TaxID=452529 RepID=A0ACD4ZNZ8_9ACTN|nr:hypothetical protein [Streptomyces scopuliridis]WSC00104.1 hypothetical protein OG835_25970 [Streptomyces scopuliridis]
MKIRADIAELLRAGLSDRAISRQLQIRTSRVRAVRSALGLAPHQPGPTPADSPEDLFWRRAVPTEDGHLLWPGADPRVGARLRHGSVRYSAFKIAFQIRWGREPIRRVTTGCTQPGCVHPAHVEDRPMREQYAAIFGQAAA